MTTQTEPLTISRAEAARLLGVSPGTLKMLHDTQGLPGYEVGGRLRFDRADIVAWKEARRRVKHAGAAPQAGAASPPPAPARPGASDFEAEVRQTRRGKGGKS